MDLYAAVGSVKVCSISILDNKSGLGRGAPVPVVPASVTAARPLAPWSTLQRIFPIL